jgi:hypothetical protein
VLDYGNHDKRIHAAFGWLLSVSDTRPPVAVMNFASAAFLKAGCFGAGKQSCYCVGVAYHFCLGWRQLIHTRLPKATGPLLMRWTALHPLRL